MNRAERYADRCLHERMERARELILLTERLGLNGEGEDILSSAENMREGEDRADKWRQLDACMDLLHGIFSEHFDSHREIIDNIVAKGDAANVDLLPLTRMLREGQAALELGDYETSINLIEQAMKEKDSIISMAVQERLAALQEECTILEEWGADLCTFKEAALLVEGEEGECTLPPLLQASEALREARVSVIQAINDIRPRLLLAPPPRHLSHTGKTGRNQETAGEDLVVLWPAGSGELTDAALWGHAELAEGFSAQWNYFSPPARWESLGPASVGNRVAPVCHRWRSDRSQSHGRREESVLRPRDAGTGRTFRVSILSRRGDGADVEKGRQTPEVLEELREGSGGTVAELCRITSILREESEGTCVGRPCRRYCLTPPSTYRSTERLEEAGDLATREALGAALLSEILSRGRSDRAP